MATMWRLMRHPGLSGARQMAIDEAFYRLASPESAPVLRFYTWLRPTLSLGYFQKYKRIVNEPFCVHNNIDVVRRITGGRSVLHHYEVTYAVVAPLTKDFANQSLQETYQLIAKALDHALQEFGVTEPAISLHPVSHPAQESRLPQCFVSVSQFEHSFRSKKIIGSAQKRSRDRFLQHGSILLDFDSVLQSGCVNHADPHIENKIAPLNRIAGRSLGFSEVTERFVESFQTVFGVRLKEDEMNHDETQLAGLLEHKYKNAAWTEPKCK